MANRERRELDVLLERALKEYVSDEAPPDRVWESIALRVRQRSGGSGSRREQLREWASEAVVWMAGAAINARIILTPVIPGCREVWPDSLALAGHASYPVYYSIQR